MTHISDFAAGRTPPELYETYLVPGLFSPWANDMAKRAASGMRCLDLASGTGAVTRALIRAHAKEVQIDAVDVAGPMLQFARRLIAQDNVAFHEASALALPFDGCVFDAVFCQQGVQFFPDPAKAFEEVLRILKPGGRFTATIWASGADSGPVFHAFEKSVARHLGEDCLPLGPFSFGSLERLGNLARDTGFDINLLETASMDAALPTIEHLVLFDLLFLGKPDAEGRLTPAIDPTDPAGDAIIEAMIDELALSLANYVQPDGTLIAPMFSHVLDATKPT